VRVFNGRGEEWRGEVADIGRQQAVVRLLEPVASAPEPRIGIAIAVAVLKGDKMDDVVRDAVMLGASAIQPLITDRTEISLGAVARGHRVDRWHRIAIASAKQCGRAVVPPVHEALTLTDWLDQPAAGDRFMLVEPGAGTPTELRAVQRPNAATLIVGPEGGWSEAEVQAAHRSRVTLVRLGAITLRADAMPIVALTAMRTLWEDL